MGSTRCPSIPGSIPTPSGSWIRLPQTHTVSNPSSPCPDMPLDTRIRFPPSPLLDVLQQGNAELDIALQCNEAA